MIFQNPLTGGIARRLHKLLAGSLAAALVLTGIGAPGFPGAETVSAAETKEVKIRLINTTDIHGQIFSEDLETGVEYAHGGLERAVAAIEEAKKAVPDANSFVFDIGDMIFDYTTERIAMERPDMIQPVLQAIKEIGYDAITLGNHEFDYGYSYIKDQLERAGLTNKVVVSNLFMSASGAHPFQETMILRKIVEATDGSTVQIEIGIIGETIPTLSQKTEVMDGGLATEDMVVNVRKKAKALKDAGVDMVVVLAHTGLGEEEPADHAENTAYALTTIPEVDVVFGGHEHRVFPAGYGDIHSANEKVYELPGADKKTNLVNGKNLVIAGSHGDYIGVVDLDCTVDGSVLTIDGRKSSTVKLTSASPAVTTFNRSMYGDMLQEFRVHSNDVIATLADGITYNNYFGLVSDNAALQLLNETKIAFGLSYTHSAAGSAYQKLPVVACSGYNAYGEEGPDDYINLQGGLTGGNLTSLQTYHAYIVLYQVTGKQLREYMEWAAASPYVTAGEKPDYEDDFMRVYTGASGISPLVYEEWMDDWSNFRIFDGVEYEIDASVDPRYDFAGNKINNTNRIVSLKINGEPVRDSDKIVLATDKILKPTAANKAITEKQLRGGYINAQDTFADILSEMNKTGMIAVQRDNNWKVNYPFGYSFLMMADMPAEKYAAEESWIDSRFVSDGTKMYYSGTYKTLADHTGPSLVATPTVFVPTDHPITIAVQARDISGVASIRYLNRSTDTVDPGWASAPVVTNGEVVAAENGTYTFLATDNLGNQSLVRVQIDQIDDNVLQVPSVNTFTNRTSAISGNAEPNTTIHIQIGKEKYEVKADANGKFSYSVKYIQSGEIVKIYAEDAGGRVSETVEVPVKRTGPNQPKLSAYARNNILKIKGDTRDSDALPIAINAKHVYGSAEALARYEKSDIYNDTYTLVETKLIMNGTEFELGIGAPDGNSKVNVYNLDSLNRRSRVTSTVTRIAAPNRPKLYHLCNAERFVYGTVTKINANDVYTITLTVNGKTYTAKTDDKGAFEIEVGVLKVGDEITATATGRVDGKESTSVVRTITVEDYRNFVDDDLVLAPTMVGATEVAGVYSPEEPVIVMVDAKRYATVCDTYGVFRVSIDNTVYRTTDIYAIAKIGASLQGVVKGTVVE